MMEAARAFETLLIF